MNLRGQYHSLGGLASTPPSHRHPVAPRQRVSRLFYDEAMSNAATPLARPYCTLLMAAYGANVVKVAEPEHGDIGRAGGAGGAGAGAGAVR